MSNSVTSTERKNPTRWNHGKKTYEDPKSFTPETLLASPTLIGIPK